MIDWKCPNPNCTGRLEDQTFYEPRVLHQSISKTGRIVTFDSSLCEGEDEGFLECDLCSYHHQPGDIVHCPDNTLSSLLDLWVERALELRKEARRKAKEERAEKLLLQDMEAVRAELQQ